MYPAHNKGFLLNGVRSIHVWCTKKKQQWLTFRSLLCFENYQLTDDLNWVNSAFESLKSSCEFQAVKNYSAFDKDEEGNLVHPSNIAQNLCPGDCNSNGNCTNGTCVCNDGLSQQTVQWDLMRFLSCLGRKWLFQKKTKRSNCRLLIWVSKWITSRRIH